MEINVETQTQKITLDLTNDQKRMLTEAFGTEFEGKIRSVEIEKVAGYLKSEVQGN